MIVMRKKEIFSITMCRGMFDMYPLYALRWNHEKNRAEMVMAIDPDGKKYSDPLSQLVKKK